MDDHRKLLRIYLNDHRAGSVAAIARVHRMAQQNRGTELGADLDWLHAQLVEDADALSDIARRFDIAENPLKRELARAGELVGRLKLNGGLLGYSPLSRLLEIELVMAGIDAKRSLWRSLTAAALPELHDVDLDRLSRRATEQRERLLPHHVSAATHALTERRPAPAFVAMPRGADDS
jgi:hypothetical protein